MSLTDGHTDICHCIVKIDSLAMSLCYFLSLLLSGTGSMLPLPNSITRQVDWEVELAVVMGKKAKYVYY